MEYFKLLNKCPQFSDYRIYFTEGGTLLQHEFCRGCYHKLLETGFRSSTTQWVVPISLDSIGTCTRNQPPEISATANDLFEQKKFFAVK